MDALEHVSEIWLVAKAVQDLFETVLSSAGYERSLDAPAGSTYRKKLGPTESVFKDPVNQGPKTGTATSDANGKSLPSKKIALTPSLRIWREAALESAVTPKVNKEHTALQRTSSSSSSGSKTAEPRVFSDDWKDISPIATVDSPALHAQGLYDAFDPTPGCSQTYFPDDQHVNWNPEWVEGMIPAPTGFNPAEW